jgi:DNA-binding XRE family transcriptional regulator
MTYEELKKKVSVLIRTNRNKKKLTQNDLAIEVGISYQDIQNYEAGIYLPRLHTMVKIAEVLDIPANSIFYDSGSRSKKK